MELDLLGNFVPKYFSLRFKFLLPLFPRATSTAKKFCFSCISENYYTNYKQLVWLFGSMKGNLLQFGINMLVYNRLYDLACVHLYLYTFRDISIK